jgi:hypothetical protein
MLSEQNPMPTRNVRACTQIQSHNNALELRVGIDGVALIAQALVPCCFAELGRRCAVRWRAWLSIGDVMPMKFACATVGIRLDLDCVALDISTPVVSRRTAPRLATRRTMPPGHPECLLGTYPLTRWVTF